MTGTFDVAVVGGGLAGLTAAHHAALDGASVVHVIGSGVPGGLVANVGELEGFPTAGSVSGLDIALALTEDNQRFGVEIVADDVTRLEVAGPAFGLQAASGTWSARAVVAATGARLRMLDVPGAARLVDKGVSQCAWCNGSLHRGQDVVVIGGGDSALQEAIHLAQYASAVVVVTRSGALRARRSLVDRAAANDRIAFRWETDVAEILGDDGVTAVRLRNRGTAKVEDMPCAGVFVYVGLEPNAAWLGGRATLDASGAVVANDEMTTSLPGLYAVGALRSGYRGRLTQAVGEATTAGAGAARWAAR